MSEFGTASFIIVTSTFLLIPTLGELISERSGVLNLGVEGMIISSAAGSYLVAYNTRNQLDLLIFTIRWSDVGLDDKLILGGHISVWIGIFAGILIGISLSAVHALLTVTFSRNQIVSGIGLTIFGTGLSGLLGKSVGGKGGQVGNLESVPIPFLENIPFFGEVFFDHDVLVYFSYIMVAGLWFFLFKTKFGIIVRATGENPSAAHNQGINVKKVRFTSVLFGGAMAGIGGAYLTLAWLSIWSDGMTNGKGWLVIALVIVALWHPLLTIVGAYIFGAIDVYGGTLESGNEIFGYEVQVPSAIVKMTPYVGTLLFLLLMTIVVNRSKIKRVLGSPSALTVPFSED
ncbi:MAG: ABC transporter permease [Candidatus Heimdallarchaeota archaeon]|nr:ABC transporter permease [Candidatus Heimdallarchaeota archaeon]